MSQSDIDWWEVLKKGSEAVTILSTVGALTGKNKGAAGIAGLSLLARIFCAFAAPPQCDRCARHMKNMNNQYWLCTVCGFVKLFT